MWYFLMQNKKLRADGMLLLTALIWGMAFVAQSRGMEDCGPFLFNGVRYLLGSAVLLPVIFALDKRAGQKREKSRWPILGGLCCGAALFAASALQQIGIIDAGAGKAGFITALYVVLVPVFGIFLKKKTTLLAWASVFVALFGMYLLCIEKTGFAVGTSDLLLLGCAALFAVHIMVIDFFAPQVDCVRMACLQFFFAGLFALVVAICTEEIRLADITAAGVPILYTGILSSGVAYTLQIVAQKDTDATSAALICSLESVFALLGGVILLGESFTSREIGGCVLTFGAILLSQVPDFKKERT